MCCLVDYFDLPKAGKAGKAAERHLMVVAESELE